jgi:hypothetical protein
MNWNLNQPTGLEILETLLQSSNEGFDFSKIVSLIESFLRKKVQESQSYFLLFDGAYFYLAALKILAQKRNWKTFLKDLFELLEDHHIHLDYSKIEQAYQHLTAPACLSINPCLVASYQNTASTNGSTTVSPQSSLSEEQRLVYRLVQTPDQKGGSAPTDDFPCESNPRGFETTRTEAQASRE